MAMLTVEDIERVLRECEDYVAANPLPPVPACGPLMHRNVMWTCLRTQIPAPYLEQYMTYFLALMKNVERKSLMVYHRTCKEPRKVLFFAKHPHAYRYSGRHNFSEPWNEALEVLAQEATRHVDRSLLPPGSEAFEFNCALVNLYETGKDCVSMHRDKDAFDYYVASFSLGATRDFYIYPDRPQGGVISIALSHGDLLMMHPGMQRYYMHALPRRLRLKEPRVNITLRYHPTSLASVG